MGYSKSNSKTEVIAIQPQLKRQEQSQISNLILYLKKLKKEQQQNKVSRRKEEVRAEINETEMNKTVTKINITKSWFLEKINKTYIPLSRIIKKKRERTQINRIRNVKGEIIIDTIEIQRTRRDCQKQLYANKIDNLYEKENFPRLNQEQLENINRPITSNQMQTVIKNLPRPDGFIANFIKYLESI